MAKRKEVGGAEDVGGGEEPDATSIPTPDLDQPIGGTPEPDEEENSLVLDDPTLADSEAPAVRAVNKLIYDALVARASDIHVESFADRIRLRYRIDGILEDVEPPDGHLRAAILARLRVMAGLDRGSPPDDRPRRAGIPGGAHDRGGHGAAAGANDLRALRRGGRLPGRGSARAGSGRAQDFTTGKVGRGCDECRGTGFLGRTGLYELLVMTDAFREAFLRKQSIRQLREIALSEGMEPLRLDGIYKVEAGITTPEEVLRVT